MRAIACVSTLIIGLLPVAMSKTAIAQVTSDGTTNTVETGRLKLANGAWLQSSSNGGSNVIW